MSDHLDDRMTRLETSVAHLQHDLETLDKAVLDNTEKLDRVFNMLKQMNQRFEGLSEGSEKRSPEEEKPPHY